MKNKHINPLFIIFLLNLSFIPCVTAQEQSINEFITQMQRSLELKDVVTYLESFSSGMRDEEESYIVNKIKLFQMDSVTFFKASDAALKKEEAQIYLRVLFQNPYSFKLETWQLSLHRMDDRWQIIKKRIIGDIHNLVKIKIPSDRVEKVKLVEVEHADIKLSFKDALLFYDNIPELETALIIIGKGSLHFSPSDPREKHQLELLYKKQFIEDKLEYAYLRFSDTFFRNNIKIKRDLNKKSYKASRAEINKAYSLFIKHYSRSFTIENSLSGEFLSIFPRRDEAIFEFEGRKIGICSYIYSPFSVEEVNFYRWKDDKIVNLYSPLSENNKRRFFISFGHMFDVENYQVDIDFNPRQSYLSGRAKVEIKSRIDSLESLKFKFSPDLDILRILDEEKRELFYTQDKVRKFLYVYFIQSPPRNTLTSVEIFYRGRLIPPEQISDVIVGPQFLEADISIPSKSETYLFSLRSFWYPSPPDDDYFNARLKIIIPYGYMCVSNGELVERTQLNRVEKVEEIEKAGSSVYVYETKYPLKYLTFIVGRLIKVKEDFDPIPLQLLHSSGIVSKKKELFEDAKDVVYFYEDKFGSYPYEKLSIIRRLWSTTGGHSPASFIILNEFPRNQRRRRIRKVKSPVDLSRWREYFVAHEIAHQWWGQCVTWRTYHDQWLAEGLAQFSTILYLREKHGEEVYSNILKKFSKWTKKKSERGAITLGSRLSYFDFEAYQAIVYNKSSLVLNMLKDILEEDLFYKGLREFFRRYSYSAASTNNFIQTFEETSGKGLKSFFKKWMDSYVLPEAKISHSIQKSEDGYILEFSVNQLKELFVYPLWIEWNENGNKVRKKIIVDKRSEKFDFELKEKPRKIKINPDEAVPGKFH